MFPKNILSVKNVPFTPVSVSKNLFLEVNAFLEESWFCKNKESISVEAKTGVCFHKTRFWGLKGPIFRLGKQYTKQK
jgi:hypothetical protein